MRESAELVLYVRKDCHLCSEMISGLNKLQAKLFFYLELVDVDSSQSLIEKYGEFVPVLMGKNEEICHFHLDPKALDAYLTKIR
jgi:hypothetical protein